MKCFWNRKFNLHAASALVMALFVLFAVGSGYIDETIDFISDVYTEVLDDGSYHKTFDLYGQTVSVVGNRDNLGREHGMRTTTGFSGTHHDATYTEYFYHGKLHGPCEYQYKTGGKVVKVYYDGNCIFEYTEGVEKSTDLLSAHGILSNKYFHYASFLTFLGYDSVYQQNYLDTLEIILNSVTFESAEFNLYYEEAEETLESTPFDSIISANEAVAFLNGFELIRDHPFRLAVFDRFLAGQEQTFETIKTTYPGLLIDLAEEDVSVSELENFCEIFDSCMVSYGNLNLEDPYFIDSLDLRIFRAILSIYEPEEETMKAAMKLAGESILSDELSSQNFHKKAASLLQPGSIKSTPSDVAGVVLSSIFMAFAEGDLIRESVRKAYFLNNGIVVLPEVGSKFETGHSPTSVTIGGYVFYNGGAEVKDRGVVWGESYHPTIDNNLKSGGTGTGEFSVTLEGLEEGSRYYARSYATNSVGTAYGSCIEFVASKSSGMQETGAESHKLMIYPNPASDMTILRFWIESPEALTLSMVNYSGQVVYQKDLGTLVQGENQIELDLSGFQAGVYLCMLNSNERTVSSEKLIIAR